MVCVSCSWYGYLLRNCPWPPLWSFSDPVCGVVLLQLLAKVDQLMKVGKNNFRPPPKVRMTETIQ